MPEDADWIARVQRSPVKLVSVSHPKWLGIKSSAHELFDHCYYIDDPVDAGSAIYYSRMLLAAGVGKLVLNGFPLSYKYLVDGLRKSAPKIEIYAIWHGSFLQSGEEVAWKGFQILLAYVRSNTIRKIGFVKQGMAEVMARNDVRTGFVMNRVRTVPTGPSPVERDGGNSKLGLWNIGGHSWRKLPFAMIAAASSARQCTLYLSGADQRIRAFAALLGANSVVSSEVTPQVLMPRMLAGMHLNLYVTLSECAPMLPLESLAVGVPCLLGPNSHYFRDNEYLHSRLVVPYPDSASVIASHIERALDERDEIVRSYIAYAPTYNERAKQSLMDFLEM